MFIAYIYSSIIFEIFENGEMRSLKEPLSKKFPQ